MNDYCFRVACPVEPFKDPNFPLEILKTDQYRHAILDRFRYINPELFAWYKSLGVKVNMVEAIYRPAHNVGDIHVDRGLGDKIKMNWIYGQSDNSHMNWFDYNPEFTTVAGTTNVNTPYITFPDDKCTKIYGQQVASPSVCQTGVPHNITNGPTSRLCISVDLLELNTMQGITFKRAQEIFRDYLVW